MKKISETNLNYLLSIIANAIKTKIYPDYVPATTSSFGIIKPDGTTLTADNGVLSRIVDENVPIATTTVNGKIKPDGVTIGIKQKTGESQADSLYVIPSFVDPDLSLPSGGLRQPEAWFVEEEEGSSEESGDSSFPYIQRIFVNSSGNVYGLCHYKPQTSLGNNGYVNTQSENGNSYYNCYINEYSNSSWGEDTTNNYEKVHSNSVILYGNYHLGDWNPSDGDDYYSIFYENSGAAVPNDYFNTTGGYVINAATDRVMRIVPNKYSNSMNTNIILPDGFNLIHTNTSVGSIMGYLVVKNGNNYNHILYRYNSNRWGTYSNFISTTKDVNYYEPPKMYFINNKIYYVSGTDFKLLNFDANSPSSDISVTVKVNGSAVNGAVYQTLRIYNNTLYGWGSFSDTYYLFKYNDTNHEWNDIASFDITNKSINDYAITSNDNVHLVTKNSSERSVEHWYFDGSDWTKIGQCIPELWKAAE